MVKESRFHPPYAEEKAAATLSEPAVCVQAIIDTVNQDVHASNTSPKVLDFCAGNGQIGQFLADKGFTDVYG
jgi:methylase of polypeptide subunit release factors